MIFFVTSDNCDMADLMEEFVGLLTRSKAFFESLVTESSELLETSFGL
jgi:hypothetical protein